MIESAYTVRILSEMQNWEEIRTPHWHNRDRNPLRTYLNRRLWSIRWRRICPRIFNKSNLPFTITDRASKVTEVKFTTEIINEEFIKMFEGKSLNKYKKPRTILSDKGKFYTSESLKNYLDENKMKQKFTSTYNPTGNGVSERVNGIINTILRIYKIWSLKIIQEVIKQRLNETYHSAIENIPIIAARDERVEIKTTKKTRG